MKKSVAVLLSLFFCFVFAGCGASDTADTDSKASSVSQASEQKDNTDSLATSTTETESSGTDTTYPTVKDPFYSDTEHTNQPQEDQPETEQTPPSSSQTQSTTSPAEKPTVHTHAYNQKVATSSFLKSSATCAKTAEYYYSCSCGEKGTKTFSSGSTLKHIYSKTVKKPTCSAEGYTEYKCACGDNYKGDYTSATHNHSFIETQKKTGNIWYYTFACRNCDVVAIDFGNADGSWSGGNENVKYYVSYTPVVKNGYVEYADCHIVIYGNGAMTDFTANSHAPWKDYLDYTKKITIANGVTTIGAYAFNCPNGATRIAVDMAPSVKTVKMKALNINVKSLVFGAGVERIEGQLNTKNLTSVYLPKSLKFFETFGSVWKPAATIYYEGSKNDFLKIQTVSYNRIETFRDTLEEWKNSDIGGDYCYVYLNASEIGDTDEYFDQSLEFN